MLENIPLFALVSYAFVMTITPGPNNLLLMSSGLLFGLRRTAHHLLGVVAGMAAQICAVGAGLGALFAWEPRLQLLVKLVGSGYMLWLSSRLWRSGAWQAAQVSQPFRFWQALVFQFVNPKAWLMATTVVAVFTPAGDHFTTRLLATSLVFVSIGLPCSGSWAVFGAGLRTWLRDPATMQRINRVMALLCASTIILFWR